MKENCSKDIAYEFSTITIRFTKEVIEVGPARIRLVKTRQIQIVCTSHGYYDNNGDRNDVITTPLLLTAH